MTHTKTKKEIADNLKEWAQLLDKVADNLEENPLNESIESLKCLISGVYIYSFILQDIHEQETKQHNG